MIWLSVILLNRSVFLQLAGVCIIVVRIQMEWRTRMSGGDMKFQFRRRPDAAIARPVTTLKRDLITNFMSVVDAEMKHFANKLFGNLLKFVQRRLGTEKNRVAMFWTRIVLSTKPWHRPSTHGLKSGTIQNTFSSFFIHLVKNPMKFDWDNTNLWHWNISFHHLMCEFLFNIIIQHFQCHQFDDAVADELGDGADSVRWGQEGGRNDAHVPRYVQRRRDADQRQGDVWRLYFGKYYQLEEILRKMYKTKMAWE